MAVAETVRILTSPARTTGGLPRPHAAAIVAADAVVRWAVACGYDVEWVAGILAGDLSGQYAAERELAREGSDRATIGREQFAERARAVEATDRQRAAELLAGLGTADFRQDSPLDDERVVRAARIAFVRLYEAGLLERTERVVAECPRCATVVDDVDAEPGELEAETLTVRFRSADGTVALGVEMIALELLAGVSAVLVPSDHPAAGNEVEVPVGGHTVAVVGDPSVDHPQAVVAGHDAEAFEVARRLGLPAVAVLDGEAVVTVAGPLFGLGRYAARAAALELLAAEDDIIERVASVEACGRCRRCGTVVVPRLGWHWFLPMADLEGAAADAVREGEVDFAPPAARDAFLARAGQGQQWCLSHQVWSGYPVPAGRCADCGQMEVAVELPSSCRKCMGELVAADDVLDTRFLGAVWPLAIAGWPDDEDAPRAAATQTTLLLGPTGLAKWAVPMAALGVRLAASVPFTRLSVHPGLIPAATDDGVGDLLDTEDRRTARLALLTTAGDLDAARELIEQLDRPPAGDADVAALAAAVEAAMAAGAPAAAADALAAALAQGVREESAGSVRAIVAPLLGKTEPPR